MLMAMMQIGEMIMLMLHCFMGMNVNMGQAAVPMLAFMGMKMMTIAMMMVMNMLC